MKKKPYAVTVVSIFEYRFMSVGPRGSFNKVIQIEALEIPDIYNFAFCNLLDDGTIDDEVEANNNDFVQIMSTLIYIIKYFLKGKKGAKLFFTGSTTQRTEVYRIILKRNYEVLSNDYKFSALIDEKGYNIEIEFDPEQDGPYLGFIVAEK